MAHYQFGDWRFDAERGLLTRRTGASDPVRLPPQPAKLLALLVEQHPEIVSHATIQQHLWPEVEVAFEQSLHHCVRQVRSALGDAASEPQYIQTVHRRGYRFLAPVTVAAPEAPVPTANPVRWWAAAGVGALLLAGLAFLFLRDPAPVRVAVMTFLPPGAATSATPLAEHLLLRLTDQRPPALEVIGPTTTAAFDGAPQRLRALVDSFRIDYVLNGRFSRDSTDPRVLAEVIRASDGAHVWVRYFDRRVPPAAVADTIAAGFLAYLRRERGG